MSQSRGTNFLLYACILPIGTVLLGNPNSPRGHTGGLIISSLSYRCAPGLLVHPYLAGVCRRARGWAVQLVVFIKASFLLVFLWLILGAECAGDTLADGEEDMSVQRSTQRTAAWKVLRVFLSKENTMKLQYLGTGGHGGQTAEAPQISLEHSGTQSPCCVLGHIALLLWGAFLCYLRPDHLSRIPQG